MNRPKGSSSITRGLANFPTHSALFVDQTYTETQGADDRVRSVRVRHRRFFFLLMFDW